MWTGGVAMVITTLAGVGCSVVSEPTDLTEAEQLRKLEGHPLSQLEIDNRLELADLMCGFDRRLLQQIWSKLDAKELEFQDFVFGQRCPDQLLLYSDARPDLGTVPEDERLNPTIPDGIAPASPPATTTPSSADRASPTGPADSTSADEGSGQDGSGGLSSKGGEGAGG